MSAEDYSLRRFLNSAAHEIADVEHSKLFRTLGALFLKPGLLTQEYFTARRVRYLKPLSLALAIFALHIFVFSVSNRVALFNLDVSMAAAPNQANSRKMETILAKVAKNRGMPVAELKQKINDKWARNFSWSQIPQVLAFAVLLKLIFLLSRRNFVEHLVFALHFYAFQVLTVVLMWPIYYVVGLRMSAVGISVAVGKFLIDVTYVYFAARRFYGDRSIKGVLRAILIFAAYTWIYFTAYLGAMTTALIAEAPHAKVAGTQVK